MQAFEDSTVKRRRLIRTRSVGANSECLVHLLCLAVLLDG